MQSTYETYSDWEKRTFCDNASRRGSGVGLHPQCVNGKREYECTVFYDKECISSDSMILCSECQKLLRQEARKHGYKFRSIRHTP